MAQKTINLKESQVRNLVEQALNELDWRTYMNAANKMKARHEQGNGRRMDWDHAWELADYAADKFNKEHNPSKNVRWEFTPTVKGNGDYSMRTNDNTHAFYLDPDNPTSVMSTEGDEDILRDFANGNYIYDKDEHTWRLRLPNEEIANNVVESVINKLRSLNESSERTLVGKFMHLAGRTGDILGLYCSPIVHVSSHSDDKRRWWEIETKEGKRIMVSGKELDELLDNGTSDSIDDRCDVFYISDRNKWPLGANFYKNVPEDQTAVFVNRYMNGEV